MYISNVGKPLCVIFVTGELILKLGSVGRACENVYLYLRFRSRGANYYLVSALKDEIDHIGRIESDILRLFALYMLDYAGLIVAELRNGDTAYGYGRTFTKRLHKLLAALNAVYSDYVKIAKKHGVGGNMDYYVDMALAWLDDKDAVQDKAAAYYRYVVKH